MTEAIRSLTGRADMTHRVTYLVFRTLLFGLGAHHVADQLAANVSTALLDNSSTHGADRRRFTTGSQCDFGESDRPDERQSTST